MEKLILGDCLEEMAKLPAGSIDLIATDLPYGTTQNKWDFIIDPVAMWKEVKRVLKPNGVFVTTGSQPFTSTLICSNLPWFKYCWAWEKQGRVTGFLDAKKKPLKAHEDIIVFSEKQGIYNPQGMIKLDKPVFAGGRNKNGRGNYGTSAYNPEKQEITNYPRSLLKIPVEVHKTAHPTQKPVALFEYLISTYSNPGNVVLDIAAGAGTTGVAARNTGRGFILIEKDPEYFRVMSERLSKP